MAQEDITALSELLEKNGANLAPESLKAAVSEIVTACSVFK
jgi:hypothetical protein